jgi:hypothetical protein
MESEDLLLCSQQHSTGPYFIYFNILHPSISSTVSTIFYKSNVSEMWYTPITRYRIGKDPTQFLSNSLSMDIQYCKI